jgi:hypothetical protein
LGWDGEVNKALLEFSEAIENPQIRSIITICALIPLRTMEPFGCADKPAEKHCWLICCERKILFRLKKQAEKDGL